MSPNNAGSATLDKSVDAHANNRPLSAWAAALFAGGLTAGAAALGARASVDAAAFYASLSKPAWAPPSEVFGPVWTVLYIGMAVAAYLALRAAHGKALTVAAVLFTAQLAANALWSWLFFAWHKGLASVVDVLLLLLLVAFTLRSFWRIKPVAGMLLVPYFLWVSFATALTIAVYANNRGTL